MAIDGKVFERLVDFLRRKKLENEISPQEKAKNQLKQSIANKYSNQKNNGTESEDGKGVRIDKTA